MDVFLDLKQDGCKEKGGLISVWGLGWVQAGCGVFREHTHTHTVSVCDPDDLAVFPTLAQPINPQPSRLWLCSCQQQESWVLGLQLFEAAYETND